MKITINTKLVSEEIRQKSHLNTRQIQDTDLKVSTRIGEDEMDEVDRCILQANGRMLTLCRKWLSPASVSANADVLTLPQKFEYEFVGTDRRLQNKAEALTQDIHSFIVSAALSRYYNSVFNDNLANMYERKALADAQDITILLNSKLPPVLS